MNDSASEGALFARVLDICRHNAWGFTLEYSEAANSFGIEIRSAAPTEEFTLKAKYALDHLIQLLEAHETQCWNGTAQR